MSVTSGFYNSLNGDRKYNAEQMSALFNGIINDGVFASIGTAFGVKAGSGKNITVGIGRAWFNSTWIDNDAILPISLSNAEVLLHRYDAVVIEVNRNDSVRSSSIKVVKGTAASNPQRPSLTKSNKIYQYPLAYIYRKGGSTAVAQSDITNMVGTSSCPYVTGILKVVNIDNIVAQWEDQWKTWTQKEQDDFYKWLNDLSDTLDGNAAAKLTDEVLELYEIVGNFQRTVKITLPANGWSSSFPYTKTVSVSGMTANDVPIAGIVYPTNCTRDQQKKINKAAGYIYDIETKAGAVTFRCTKKPETEITISLTGISSTDSLRKYYIRDSDENLLLDSAAKPISEAEE